MGDRPLVMLPAAVLERVPQLHDARTFFFDFGLLLAESNTTTPVVVVLTDQSLVVASFPSATQAPVIMPHSSIVGVTRDGSLLTIRNSHMPEMQLQLPKADTFAVHLINMQDKSMNRALRLGADANFAAKPSKEAHSAATSDRALRTAESTLGADESDLGVFRFGYSSLRTVAPAVELDEGSDASSIQTLDNEVDDMPPDGIVDIPPASINPHSLHRRLRYFFMCYDRSKLMFIDNMITQHRGREAELIRELEMQYGPEPNKLRWETHDRMAHQREVNALLRAQLRRAQDEMLLLQHQTSQKHRSLERTEKLQQAFVDAMTQRPPSGDENNFQLLSVSDANREVHHFIAPQTLVEDLNGQARTVLNATEPPHVRICDTSGNLLCQVNKHFFGTVAMDALGANFIMSVQQGGRHFFVPVTNFLT